MNLSDLQVAKTILESRIKEKEEWRDSERGHNYEEYCRRELIYQEDKNHLKLIKVNRLIEEIIRNI